MRVEGFRAPLDVLCTTDPEGREETSIAENALIERLRAGDEAAFSDLVAALHGSLIRLARTLVTDLGVAEEVVQETWLGVLKGLQSFERRSSLRTWIYRILLNRGRTRGARDRRLVTFGALGESDGVSSSLADRCTSYGGWKQPPPIRREETPEDLLLRREAIEWLQQAIASLPPAQRAVITLRDIEGVDGPEICHILAISRTNQRVLLHRARTKARAALENHLDRCCFSTRKS
jgi:RNA polymerase sigma-70 factor, ECF subfamily